MYFVHCQEADPRQSRSVPDTEAGRQAGIGGVRRSVLIWWEGKVLLTFIMVKIYRRVMFCYASTWPRSMWLVLGRIKLRRDP